jgi:hypothetical protein
MVSNARPNAPSTRSEPGVGGSPAPAGASGEAAGAAYGLKPGEAGCTSAL